MRPRPCLLDTAVIAYGHRWPIANQGRLALQRRVKPAKTGGIFLRAPALFFISQTFLHVMTISFLSQHMRFGIGSHRSRWSQCGSPTVFPECPPEPTRNPLLRAAHDKNARRLRVYIYSFRIRAIRSLAAGKCRFLPLPVLADSLPATGMASCARHSTARHP